MIDFRRPPIDTELSFQIIVHLVEELGDRPDGPLLVAAITQDTFRLTLCSRVGRINIARILSDSGIPVHDPRGTGVIPNHMTISTGATTLTAGPVEDGSQVHFLTEGVIPVQVDLGLVEIVFPLIQEVFSMARFGVMGQVHGPILHSVIAGIYSIVVFIPVPTSCVEFFKIVAYTVAISIITQLLIGQQGSGKGAVIGGHILLIEVLAMPLGSSQSIKLKPIGIAGLITSAEVVSPGIGPGAFVKAIADLANDGTAEGQAIVD